MFSLINVVKQILVTDSVCIDNKIFGLHSRFTVVVLVTFSILVTYRQYFGDPIDCDKGTNNIPEKFMNTFCWIQTTFTMPYAWSEKVGVDGVPFPGIAKYTGKEPRKHISYYQWVCFVLFLHAIFFYMPGLIWRHWEGGKMKTLVSGLKQGYAMKAKDKEQSIQVLIEYLKSSMHYHKTYVACFMFCEILNFANVIGQIYLEDIFLGGEFIKYGFQDLSIPSRNPGSSRNDTMVKVFPRMTKCTFYVYGYSGDLSKLDALCMLPLNILNEKIYIFLWYWFSILTVLSAGAVAFSVLVLLWPAARFLVLRSRSRLVDKGDLHFIVSRISFGDWFVLHLLSKNLHSLHFRDLVKEFASELKKEEKPFNKSIWEIFISFFKDKSIRDTVFSLFKCKHEKPGHIFSL